MKKSSARNNKLIKAITSFLILTIIVVGVSVFLVFESALIGPAFLGIGVISILLMSFFDIELKQVYPDIVFGIIDNGILVFAAVLGANYAGVAGAIIGGAAGNTITDGIGGLFEGHIADHQREFEIDNLRTSVSTMLGKMCGCLFGAGAGLIIVWMIMLL